MSPLKKKKPFLLLSQWGLGCFIFLFYYLQPKESQLIHQLFPSAPQHLLYPYILPWPYCEELTKTQCPSEDETSRTFCLREEWKSMLMILPSVLMVEHIVQYTCRGIVYLEEEWIKSMESKSEKK